MSDPTSPTSIDRSLARLTAWLETMRTDGQSGDARGLPGYGGPVVHWWQQSLLYTGAGFDWRYEGILFGYCTLWERTRQPIWLERACQAGIHLLTAQTPDGHFATSAFEFNPASGGTPHEAAADLGLLHLASLLRARSDPNAERFVQTAIRNLQGYYLDKLWDAERKHFRDHPQINSFVPNKAATACEALFAWSRYSGEERWALAYALPCLEHLLSHQVTEKTPLHGAIAQYSLNGKVNPKYMPFYNARCIPALVEAYQLTCSPRYLDSAVSALDFIIRHVQADGSLPPALYPKGQVSPHPAWVAGLGDVLRAADLLRPFGWSGDTQAMEARLLGGQDEGGGIQTAIGFAAQTGGKPGELPDVRDVLHVAGWADKAFHYLAGKASGAPLPAEVSRPFTAECTFRGRRMTFTETPERVEVSAQGKTLYLWIKGERWARCADPAFWLH